MTDEHYDLEAVYESEIAPLISQVLAICTKYDIPFIASVQYGHNAEAWSMTSSWYFPDARTSPRYTAVRHALTNKTTWREEQAEDATP